MDYIDQLFDVEIILKKYLKECNSQKETWILTGGGMRTYHHPFQVELTYEKCGSFEEEKFCFYIVKSNNARGSHLLQRERQRFGYDNTGVGMGGTDGSEISIWRQNYHSSFQSNECKGTRGRFRVCEDIITNMNFSDNFDTDEEKYILTKIEGVGFQHSISHLKKDKGVA